MMKYFFCILIAVSLLFGILSSNVSAVSNAALSECANAVNLCISLTGIMCFWSGIMKVAEKSGLSSALSKVFFPLSKFLFPGLKRNSKALAIIMLNIASNLLGLGNAATPFGIAAMKELEKEDNTTDTASNNMITFVILNTASIQIIPTTIAALRLKNGSQSPMEILPGVWIVSILSVTVSVAVVKILNKRNNILQVKEQHYK